MDCLMGRVRQPNLMVTSALDSSKNTNTTVRVPISFPMVANIFGCGKLTKVRIREMKKFINFYRVILAMVLSLPISCLSSDILANLNPNNLPPCPSPDVSKQFDWERHFHWNNCWGKYKAEVGDLKGDEIESEWKSGLSSGKGIYIWANGDIYVGDFSQGNWGHASYSKEALGIFLWANGDRYIGQFKYSRRSGEGVLIKKNGDRIEGIWNWDFIKEPFGVNIPFIFENEKIDLSRLSKFRDELQPLDPQKTDVAINEERRKLDANLQTQSKLPPCPAVDYSKNTHAGVGGRTEKWHNCFGRYVAELNDAFKGHVYDGEFRNGMFNGQGTYSYPDGEKYVGKWKDGKRNDQGTYTTADGRVLEGIWADNKFVRAEKVNLPPVQQQTDIALNEERRRLDADRQALEVERQRLTEERNRREQAKQSSKLSLQTTTTNPDANGVVIISVRTNADTSSLKVNGNEEGSKVDGNYTIKRVARVSQDTEYTIIATDVFGNTASTTITVARQTVSQSSNQSASLKPENIKRAATRDAVAIIIGIQNYKRVPKAEFANSDAKEFYEYAIRGLGIKPENIKLLLDEEADEIEIVKAFQNWLPLQVTKNKTDVYVFYSGHGLPSEDGQSLYFLPYGVDKQFLSRTAVGQKEVVSSLVASKPKSVTMFIDACYSGQTRGGETLLASAKPIALKTDNNTFPSNFTVISASANDQISSSSPELKHGIFSFYLMKGMEGDADGNKDGKITAGEMQEYLSDKVSRQAMSMSRKQDTQLVGDANRVLMGR
jgi:hypothetical protein